MTPQCVIFELVFLTVYFLKNNSVHLCSVFKIKIYINHDSVNIYITLVKIVKRYFPGFKATCAS